MSFLDINQIDENALHEMQQAEQEAKMERLSERFNKRFNKNQPFLVKHKETRAQSNWLSYFFNIISLIGLLYAVQELLTIIPIPYLNWVIAVFLLVGFEILKRRYSDKFWDHYWSTSNIHYVYGVINFLLLFGISIAGSAFGMYFVTTDNAPEAKAIGINDDPEAVSLQERLSSIDEELSYHKGNKNEKGVVYWPSQKAIQSLSQERLAVSETLQTKFGVFEVKNTQILSEWKLRKDFRAYAAILLTILFEFLFEVCMRFNSKYDYQLWIATEKEKEKKKSGSPIRVPDPVKKKPNPVNGASLMPAV
jgi:hypothetical protein